MRRILFASALFAATVVQAQAFDLTALKERMFDCDGPGVTLAHRFAGETGTSETEAEGYATLDMIEMLISRDGEANGTLSNAARAHVEGAKAVAVTQAAALLEKCGVDIPADATVTNPLIP